MRALLARLPDGNDFQNALRLVAASAVFTAAVARWRAGQAALAPDARLSHAAALLQMLHGAPPTPAQVAALDSYFVSVCDHGVNASALAARAVASTGAGLASAVLAGLSALKGPRQGGAPGPVLDMLDAIGVPSSARAWLEGAVAQGQRLMGFGHSVYRVRDPRADALKAALQALSAYGGVAPARLALAEAVEQAALGLLRESKPGRVLETNVVFYAALLLEALGFERESLTCVFAAGRVGGWIAHAREHVHDRRLPLPAQGARWPAGLRDRFVGRALVLMHDQPAQDWTIGELGRRVGLSRSALHERFVQLIGMPPMRHLAQWRMQAGARLLLETRSTVASIAVDVGYDSEAAFARAFKRSVGKPPAAWRRERDEGIGSKGPPRV